MQGAMTSTVLRQNNRRRIYQYIYESPQPVTKQDVARALELSMPTVSSNLQDFLSEGLLSYTGTLASTGGRKPRVISLVSDARFSVGLSIMDNALRLTAVDLKTQELAQQKIFLPFAHTPAYYTQVSQLVEAFLDAHPLPREKMLGLGITFPGIVDREQQRLIFAPTLGLRDVSLEEIRPYFDRYPLFIENDANASGYAESWLRKSTRNLVYLSVERGVGGALFFNSGRYTGDNGRSGEFGHIRLVPGGRLCRCGRHGCLEAYCSTSRLSDDLDITLEEFFTMLDNGNDQIALTWQRYLSHLTDGLAMIRMALDCDIVLGGMLAAHLEKHLDTIRREVCRKTLFDHNGDFLTLDMFRANGACVGAALHHVNDFLSSF